MHNNGYLFCNNTQLETLINCNQAELKKLIRVLLFCTEKETETLCEILSTISGTVTEYTKNNRGKFVQNGCTVTISSFGIMIEEI